MKEINLELKKRIYNQRTSVIKVNKKVSCWRWAGTFGGSRRLLRSYAAEERCLHRWCTREREHSPKTSRYNPVSLDSKIYELVLAEWSAKLKVPPNTKRARTGEPNTQPVTKSGQCKKQIQHIYTVYYTASEPAIWRCIAIQIFSLNLAYREREPKKRNLERTASGYS